MGNVIGLLYILTLFAIALLFVYIPIFIARSRNIGGRDMTTITVLSWLGILFGITWIVALTLSFAWGSRSRTDPSPRQ
ncbi:MAG: hypothetical protein LBB08_01795 [Rickettsiales bacterium]|jgi:hypothetical protein|nr:hypothetical protein [Rickettsiales bacterium]